MFDPAELRRDLVLVGGGHSHALALRMLSMKPIQGLRITLVSPDSHTPYSGMLPGLVAGHYSFEDAHIDLARLCQWAQVRFVAGEVTGLDPTSRSLSLLGRPSLEYDVVSLDIGSQPELDSVPGARAHAVPVKPVAGLWQRWQELRGRLLARAIDDDFRIAVVGGGAGSVELAMAMAHDLESERINIDLWCGASEILQGYNGSARRAVMQAMARQGIDLHLAARVERVEGDVLVLAGGERAIYDELFWCTGAAAAPWIADSGLGTDSQGFLAVTDTLQSVDDERVFAAGDIATQVNHPRPKAGVYAVRQGPVLAHNLRALLLDRPLKRHRPQRRFLSLVSLGGRRAVADKGIIAAEGAWVWRWKDRIDREFMGRFQQLPTGMSDKAGDRLPELPAVNASHCGGCGAKVAGATLSEVLHSLADEFPGYCFPGGEDASPVPLEGGNQLLQSLDSLRQLVSDPWLMGRIAANHALSDLYACGARPVSALASITVPFSGPAMQRRDLHQLLSGALTEFSGVDCVLTGGHSMQGPELNIGFAVNGVSMDAGGRLLAKRDTLVGDSLVLTKPLGTGVLLAAHMQLAVDGRHLAQAIETMLQSNLPAAQLALAHGASAATDITGYGLAGHLLEMLADQQGADLVLDAIPVIAGAGEALEAGFSSTLQADNAELAAGKLTSNSSDPSILFDPQTSGGLLIAIPAARAGGLRDALRQAGYSCAEIIGEVKHRDIAREAALKTI